MLEWIETKAELDNLDTNLTDEFYLNYLYRAALRIPSLPLPSSTQTQGIVSTYDVSSDWIPIYDKSSIDGFYLAIGTSGNQFKCAPVGMLFCFV